VVADTETRYGNAVNVAYPVPRHAAAGVAAVVMEDKTFPKDSSLRPGGRQVLVPIEEFQGKVQPARMSGGPMAVARTKALIAGSRRDQALGRGCGLCRGRCRCCARSQQTEDDPGDSENLPRLARTGAARASTYLLPAALLRRGGGTG
jgi:isocitrate lyase